MGTPWTTCAMPVWKVEIFNKTKHCYLYTASYTRAWARGQIDRLLPFLDRYRYARSLKRGGVWLARRRLDFVIHRKVRSNVA